MSNSPVLQVREAQMPVAFAGLPLWETIASIGKKALFVTSVPFYWLVFFTRILQWYDANFFIFVVIASMVLSVLGKNWGILHFLAR